MEKNSIDPRTLDLVMQDDSFVIYHRDLPLKTSGGNIFSHADDRLLLNIIIDLQIPGTGTPHDISLLRLMEFQKDCIEKGKDQITTEFDMLSGKDEFILMKTGKKLERFHQEVQNLSGDAIPDQIQTVFWSVSLIINALNIFLADHIRYLEPAEETEHPFICLLKQEYEHLLPGQKAVINLLSKAHDSGLVLPFLFATEMITAPEYAHGCMAVRRNPGWEKKYGYRDLLQEANIAQEYLYYQSAGRKTDLSIPLLAKKGEGEHLEFKSTLRWDLKLGKTNPHVERASLKTICAFLNSAGGILLIGIRDDGSPEGIESDRFVNEDKFLLHLWTLIRTSMGRDVSPFIHTRLEKSGDKTVCILKCSASSRPVFLRQPGFDEEFFIRLGPSSAALDISEALKYIRDRFNDLENKDYTEGR